MKHGLDPAYFPSLPGFAWQVCLNMTGVQLELLTDPNMFVMFEEGIRGGISQVSHGYAKANNKYMKTYDENKDSSFLEYKDANNLYGYAVTEKLPVRNFKWVKNVSKIDEYFIKNYDKDGDIGYFLKLDTEHPRELHDLHIDLPFLLNKMEIIKCNKLVYNLYDKKSMLSI